MLNFWYYFDYVILISTLGFLLYLHFIKKEQRENSLIATLLFFKLTTCLFFIPVLNTFLFGSLGYYGTFLLPISMVILLSCLTFKLYPKALFILFVPLISLISKSIQIIVLMFPVFTMVAYSIAYLIKLHHKPTLYIALCITLGLFGYLANWLYFILFIYMLYRLFIKRKNLLHNKVAKKII